MGIKEDLLDFVPFNEQEEVDCKFILDRLACDCRVFHRESLAHMTVSIWVVDPTYSQTLMIYHNTYDSWSWIGGHADGDEDLPKVALKELQEETGVTNAVIAPYGPGSILSCEVLTVDGHEKRGEYLSSHLHLNITYLAIANPDERIRIKEDENSDVRWVPLRDAVSMSTEPWIRDRIYRKLIDKTLEYARR